MSVDRLTPPGCSHTRGGRPARVEAVDSRAPWTSTSIRGRSSSGSTGFRSRTGASRPTRPRRAPRRRSSAARSSSRRRCSPAGAGRPAASSSRARADEAEARARRDPRHGHPRPRRHEGSGSSAPRTSRASTTSRSRSTAARRSRSSCSRRRAAWTSRRWPRRARTRSSGSTSIRSRAAIRGTRGGSCTTAASSDPSEQKQIAAIVAKLYDAFVATEAMLCEINPLIVTPEGEVRALDSKFTVDDNALFRHPDIAELRDVAGGGSARGARAREGRDVREARRRGRRPRQRGGPDDVDRRRRDVRRRTARELLRPRRRRRRAGRRGRARGHHARRAGARDLLQHLRRDHALRRGRARDPAGGRRRWGSSCRSSCASTGRTPRRAGASSPRRRSPNLSTEATMLDGARRAVELAA